MVIAERSRGKQRIYAAAAVLFRDKGYKATSMRDLASSVGLEPSSLYSHIKSKQELLHDICFECGARFLLGIENISNSRRMAHEKIYDLIELHVQVATDDVTATTVFNDEWRHIEQPALAEFKAMRKSYEDQCQSIIEDGIEAGTFRPIQSHIVLNAILSSTQWIQRSKVQDAESVTNTLADLVLNGLLQQNDKL